MLRTFTHTAAVFFLSASSRRLIRNAVMQDNMRSQQIQSRALQAIQEDQRAESDTIMKGWEQRQQVYDEISRRQENAILGTLDVVDPTTGQSYKVSNYNDYHGKDCFRSSCVHLNSRGRRCEPPMM